MSELSSVGPDSDSLVKRNRAVRWAVLLGSAAAIPTAIGIFAHYTINRLVEFPGDTPLFWIASLAIGTELFARISPRYWVMIPQVQFFVTLNPLYSTFFKGDPNVIYGPGGDGPAYPWERRSEKSNGSLEVITVPWTESVPGADAQLIVTGSYQFKVDIKLADRFIGIDESTIQGGVIDLIKAEVSSMLSTMSVDDAKSKIGELNERLGVKFGIRDAKSRDPEVNDFEKQYGLVSVKVTISGIDLPERVQKTRDAKDEAKQALEGVANLYGITPVKLREKLDKGDLPFQEYNEMLDRFAAFSDNATMNIQAFKINNPEQIAKIFARAFGGKV